MTQALFAHLKSNLKRNETIVFLFAVRKQNKSASKSFVSCWVNLLLLCLQAFMMRYYQFEEQFCVADKTFVCFWKQLPVADVLAFFFVFLMFIHQRMKKCYI